MTGSHLFPFWPPSTNEIWRHGRKVYLTTEAKRFRALIGHEMQVARSRKAMPTLMLAGDIGVALKFFPPDRRRRDIDNLLKSVLDAMTYAGLWRDDSQIKRLSVVMEPPRQQEKRAGGSFWMSVEELHGNIVSEKVGAVA